jgi:uncharacterized protein (TIGR02594 family)
MVALPARYAWLAAEPGPKMLVEALKLYGVHEVKGDADNPVILGWAKEIGINEYRHDSIAWCGLFAAITAHRAGWDIVENPLWAANWLKWGVPAPTPMLGDILVFSRPGGNHVGLYVGEDPLAFSVLGGNQGDKVSIVRIAKSRLRGARRAKWRVSQPTNVRKTFLTEKGGLSKNES